MFRRVSRKSEPRDALRRGGGRTSPIQLRAPADLAGYTGLAQGRLAGVHVLAAAHGARVMAASLTGLQRTAGNRQVAASMDICMRDGAPDDDRTADHPATCPGYEPREGRQSRTSAGHLDPDVRDAGNGVLLITDFPVGDHRMRRSVSDDPRYREWRERFEQNDSYQLKIFGFSDCVGQRARNERLRYERATAVYDSLLPGTRSRVRLKGPFDITQFLVDNLTPANRATNRGVLIAFEQQHAPEEIPGERDLLPRVVEHSRRALTDSPYDQEFIGCWLDALRTKGFNDLYVNGFKWLEHTQELEPPSPYTTLLEKRSVQELASLGIVRRIRDDLIADIVPGEDLEKTRRTLRGVANRYHKGISVGAAIARKYGMGGGSAISPGDKQLIDHIAASTTRPGIHRCYLEFYEGG